MTEPDEPLIDGTDEEATMRLLRLAGPRAPAPAARAARVRAAVHAEWETGVRQRAARRRSLLLGGALAAAAVLAIVVLPWRERTAPLGEPVAIVERVEGQVRLQRDHSVRAGEWIETGGDGRVALRFPDGTSARVDAGSRLRPLSTRAIELAAGAVYVDTGSETGRFEVRTPLATARDVGTQFEVRLLDRTLRLRIRTGVVELVDRTRTLTGRAGTEITMSPTGAVSRPFAAHGPDWAWIAGLAPDIAMEGLTLAEFLGRVAREQGWTIQYGDATIAREAAGIVLHGSVGGLAPHEAVQVAVATSGLRHRLDKGELLVFREGADKPESRP